MGLQLRFTSHPSFCSEVSAWIRKQVLSHKHILVPFHLPLFKIREGPQTLKDFLHNFKEWDAWLQHHSIDDVQCPCSKFATQLPECCMTHGHVVAGIEQLGCLHRSFEKIGSGSAASAFFPAKHQSFKHNLKMFSSWRRKHCFPQSLESEFRSLLHLQWEKHVQHLSQEARLTWKDVSAARSLLHRYFVVHCEDHEPNHLMVYCPQFYFKAALRTWQDPAVFEPVEGSPEQLSKWVLGRIPGLLKKRYKWGINPSGTLPVGFIFLKRKKEFLKGRTIISYSNSCIKELLKAASQAILLMIRLVWPEAMGLATTPQLWKNMHSFLHRVHPTIHLAEVNDDLVGFFNSVPRQQILDSLSALIELYQRREYPHHISVCLQKRPNCESAWPGKPRAKGAKHIRFLHVSDLIDIVKVSFEVGVFTTLGLLFRQHRGTCIGNQISPVLSSLPVIQRESSWQREWAHFLDSARFFDTAASELFICRYVDNRLILCDETVLSHQCLTDFQNLSFYGRTIQLEEVTNHQFLGFRLNAANRTVTYIQPEKAWSIRSPLSAGSWSARMSRYLSRKALIVQYSWPPNPRSKQVQALRNLYIARGFPDSVLP